VTATAALAREYSERANAYERYWAPFLQPFILPMLDSLPLGSAQDVLDLGAGTGQLAAPIRARSPGCRLVLADRAAGMIRLAPSGPRNSRVVADGQQLGFADHTFDVTVLAFVLFHFPIPREGLVEVRRVLRKNGVVGVTTWGDDPGVPGASIWTEELNAAGAAPDPRDPSIMQQGTMNTPEKLLALLEESGFENIEVESRRFEYPWTVESLLRVQLGCGVGSRRIGSLPAEAAERCRVRVEERLRNLTSEQLLYRPEVLWASAGRA